MNKIFKLLEEYKKYFWPIFVIGVVVYSPIFFNGFVWDDIPFIINNPEVHQLDIFSLLGQNMFSTGLFYRPIPAIYFATLYSLFGQHAFYYHAVQLFLHLVGTCLLFVFFRKFFSVGITFFLTFIFLVHPINVESVAYIGSTLSELYFIPGILALIFAQEEHISTSRFIWIVIFLALSIFTKEVGFLFFLLVIAYRLLFKLDRVGSFFTAGSGLTLFYLLIRALKGGETWSISTRISIASLSLMERLLNIPAVFVYYLKIFFFPATLTVWQTWVIKTIAPENFIIPLIISLVFIFFLLGTAYILFKKKSKLSVIPLEHFKDKYERREHIAQTERQLTNAQSFLFFFVWFMIGMGLLLHLVPLDMTVADRWFYFPIVGMLGMIGVYLASIQASRIYKNRGFLVFAVIILSLFSLRTFVRNFDYKDNMTLYQHDVHAGGGNNYILLNAYANELFAAKKLDEAYAYTQKSIAIHPTANNLTNVGRYYQEKKQYDKALAAYSRAVEQYDIENRDIIRVVKDRKDFIINEVAAAPYKNKANLLANFKPEEAIDFINNKALKLFPADPHLYFFLAQVEMRSNHPQEALTAASRAYDLAPDNPEVTQLYLQLTNTN